MLRVFLLVFCFGVFLVVLVAFLNLWEFGGELGRS